MSLRIKLPVKPSDSDSQSPATQPQRRKSAKRRLTVDSDDEYTDNPPSSPPSPSHPQKQPRRRHTPADDTDIVQDYDQEEYAAVDVTETRVSASSNRKQSHSGPPQKKKRALTPDDDFEGDDDLLGEVNRDMETDEDYEDEYETKKTNTKGRGKQKSAKGGPGNKSGKGKGKAELNDLDMKEDASGTAAVSTLKRSRANTKYSEDANIDVVGDSPPSQPQKQATQTSPVPKEPSPAPPPPKKRKLPTIKKNKVATSGPATPTSQANATTKSASQPSTKAATEASSSAALPHMAHRKALQGNTDVDLRNANVYAELFKGGGAPRAGSNRRERDEERRKELNKMRDDARVGRLADAQNAFDLQAQMEKIARFEESLRRDRSSALYPNFLAGKWREMMEKEKRRKEKEVASEVGTPGPEEGEV